LSFPAQPCSCAPASIQMNLAGLLYGPIMQISALCWRVTCCFWCSDTINKRCNEHLCVLWEKVSLAYRPKSVDDVSLRSSLSTYCLPFSCFFFY
jgi:hypothetical protein